MQRSVASKATFALDFAGNLLRSPRIVNLSSFPEGLFTESKAIIHLIRLSRLDYWDRFNLSDRLHPRILIVASREK
jgi:hypothetical protein